MPAPEISPYATPKRYNEKWMLFVPAIITLSLLKVGVLGWWLVNTLLVAQPS